MNARGDTALYLRLSREDEEREGESQSIVNQRMFLLRYAEEHGMAVYDCYADDGYTGTNFDRPSFHRMVDDIEAGWIRTVLVKDLSRLGRDHIDTGYYFERYFPARKVRFIAVNDAIDTERDTAGNDMGLFRAAFNDLYAKDISKKVVSALNSKKRAGEFIGASAPYGYEKDPERRNHLVVAPEQAAVVRDIYERFLAGESYIGIARWLDARKIPPPSQKARGWNDTTVRRILTNPTYMGTLTQNRTRKVNYKVKLRRALPPEQWIQIPETHEDIVTPTCFAQVQELVQSRSRGGSAVPRPLGGLLYCAGCGARMAFVRRGPYSYAVCSRWKRSGGDVCSSHCCSEQALETVLGGWLSDEIKHRLPAAGEHQITAWVRELYAAVFQRVELTEEKELALFLRVSL